MLVASLWECEKEREQESQALPAYPRDLEREGTETVVTSCTKRVMIAQGERDWRLPLSVGFFLITQYNFRHVLLYRASYARSLGTSGYSRGHSASLGPPPGCARGVSVFVVLQLPHFRYLAEDDARSREKRAWQVWEERQS